MGAWGSGEECGHAMKMGGEGVGGGGGGRGGGVMQGGGGGEGGVWAGGAYGRGGGGGGGGARGGDGSLCGVSEELNKSCKPIHGENLGVADKRVRGSRFIRC